ncbi:lysophospholipid acyltransferase family protein [Nocardioides pelophilus]|uniref:lysophospholipid acyltransferase family protein n=1 Tax=Nocardioides pelophilus TaxID=2172019 RepID=UPI0015FEBD31|nr:lysophospholipid acyltransferase family protein [Nocardioides pelophilus]
MSEREDAESLADAVLDAVEEDLQPHEDSGVPDAVLTTLSILKKLGIDWVRRYHRLELSGELLKPDQQVLFVANHGFGGIVDLNVFAALATFDSLGIDRPITFLTHQIAWTMRVGKLFEPFGARPASREAAEAGFAEGGHVFVMPGGDLDAFKGFKDRNKIVFGGRSGFARLAIDAGVPIVPIVTAGAGESLMVLSDGQRLARALRLDKTLRVKALPVSVSLPWGLNVGGVGLLPYLPLPTKLATRVLPAMTAGPEESAADFATRVESEMQQALTALAEERR